MSLTKPVGSDKVSIKRKLKFHEEKDSSKFVKGSNEAGVSDIRQATFN